MTGATRPVEIVLTGGPCSGKTTALRYLVDHLSGRGWRVLVVPEAATLLITGGLADIGHLAGKDRPRFLTVQRHLTSLQRTLRASYLALAADLADGVTDKVVVLYDRAELDNSAYMDDDEFRSVLAAVTGTGPGEVGAQYDAVVHLVTAADGANEFYSLANNEARTESPEDAIALDRAVQASWLGHPHLVVIGNPPTGGFDAKLTRILAAVLNILGEPEPVEIERKWLLPEPPPADLLATSAPVDIFQVYLRPEQGPDGLVERRVRSRTHDGHTVYFHTTKRPAPGGGRVEHEERIGAETFRLLAAMRDPDTVPVRKRRHCFVHEGQHFELDHLAEPVEAWLLEAELVAVGETVTLPDALDGTVEVTEDPTWKNAHIARHYGPASGGRP